MGRPRKEDSGKQKISREHIVTAIEALEAAVDEWKTATDTELLAYFNGRPVKMISQGIEIAAAAVFELVDTNEIDQDARDLAISVDEFEKAIVNYAEKIHLGVKSFDPSGGPEVWGPYSRLVAAKTPRRRHRMEPIQQLIAEKVPRTQIAKMYGFVQGDGTPDLDRLQREITTPGSEFSPSQWIHPVDKKYDDSVVAAWEKRRNNREQRAIEEKTGGKKEAAETLEELIYQGVNPAQIAKMKGMEVEDVRDEANRLGVALDSSTVVHRSYAEAQRQMADQNQKHIQRQLEINKLNTHPDLGPRMEERIYAMHEDGVRPSLIVEALKEDFRGMTIHEAKGIISRLDKTRELSKPHDPILTIQNGEKTESKELAGL